MKQATLKDHSIVRIYFLSLIGAIFILLLYEAIQSIVSEYRLFERETQEMEQRYINSQRNVVRDEVNKVFSLVEIEKRLLKQRLKEEIKRRVNDVITLLSQWRATRLEVL